MTRFHPWLAVLLSQTLPMAAIAQWNEVGDAPALPPGQQTSGSGSLWQINGTLGASSDVDTYQIYIYDPWNFYADTSGAGFDTQLFLFNDAGFGVTHNDDVSASDATSRITYQFLPGPGLYLLSISRYDRDPVSNGSAIWNDAPFEIERAPDGPGAAGPVTAWSGATGGGVSYSIQLYGVQFASQPGYGACCLPQGCQQMYSGDCAANGGTYQGDNSQCTPTTCLPTGPDVWAEPVDASAVVPGQATFGPGALNYITGALSSANEVDMYLINITDPGVFSASTIGLAAFDTQLFLFNANGRGIVHDDDWAGPQSQISGQFVNAPGIYGLAISSWDRDPLTSAGQAMWNDSPDFQEHQPDGPGGSGSLWQWSGTGTDSGAYAIHLTGCAFFQDTGDGSKVIVVHPVGPNTPVPIGPNDKVDKVAVVQLPGGREAVVVRTVPMPKKPRFNIQTPAGVQHPYVNGASAVEGIRVEYRVDVANDGTGDVYTVVAEYFRGGEKVAEGKIKFPLGSVLIPDPPQPPGASFVCPDAFALSAADEAAVLSYLDLQNTPSAETWWVPSGAILFSASGTRQQLVHCSNAPPALPSDSCFAARLIDVGVTAYTNRGADSDGPSVCGSMGTDVWFRYIAPCTGTLTVGTCTAFRTYDTVLTAYSGASCTGPVLACNDDTGGACQLGSTISLPVNAGGAYTIQAGGFQGASGWAELVVTLFPNQPELQIVQQPTWQAVPLGGTAVFNVVASGVGLQYQWHVAGVPIPGATGPTLTIPNVQSDDTGPRHVYVYDSCDRLVRSHSADLTVYPDCLPPVADPGGCYIPDVWKIDPVPWLRDSPPQNKIDDLIDANPGVRFDIIVDFRECVTPGHLQFLENISPQSSVQQSYRVISSVTMRSVLHAEAVMIAAHPDVALIERQLNLVPDLDYSLATIGVVPPPNDPNDPSNVVVAYGLNGDSINVAVVDSGVDDTDHETFAGAYVFGYDATTDMEVNPDDGSADGHGTAMASIVLGRGGVTVWPGVATKAGLIDVKVIPSDPLPAAQSNVALAAFQKLLERQREWNVHVVLASFHIGVGAPQDTDGLDAVSQLVDRLVELGMIVVASAGNEFPSGVARPPGRAARALTVAASNDQDTADPVDDVIYPSSQGGPASDNGNLDDYDELKPELTAPGVQIFAAAANSPSAGQQVDGTSAAAAHVAGVAALCRQARPDMNPESLRAALINTARRTGPASPAGVGRFPAGWNERWGWGLLDAFAAVERLHTPGPTEIEFGPGGGQPWNNYNIGVVDFPPRCSVPTQVFANVRNTGANPATNVRVTFGLYDLISANPGFIYGGTEVIPLLGPGQAITVMMDWLPNCVGVVQHQCLKVEIGCDTDIDTLNNFAQINLDITASPVYFQVANFVSSAPITISFAASFENPAAGWGVQITPPFVTLGPDDLPPTIEVLPLPPPGANDGDSNVVHIAAEASNGMCLGGVSVIAVVRDCNNNHIDDWFDIRDGLSDDQDGNGVPDECECPTDFNHDGISDLNDLTILLGNYGTLAGADQSDGDTDGDGDIDLGDLTQLLSAFGTVCG